MSTYPDANSLTIPVDDRIANKYPLPADWDPTDKTLLDATRLMNMFTGLCNGAYRGSAGKIYATATALNAVTGEKGEIAYCTETDSIYKWDTATSTWIKLSNESEIGNITDLLATKVDKETGKGLSANDYTTTEKNKLSGIDTGAQVNDIVDVTVDGISAVDENKVAKISNNYILGYSQLADKIISNSLVETSLLNKNINEYIKTNIIYADTLKTGDIIDINIYGKISGGTGVIPTFRFKFGSVVLAVVSEALANAYLDVDLKINAKIIIRSVGESGTALVKGEINLLSVGDSGSIEEATNIDVKHALPSAQSTIDTTINNAVDVTLQWNSESVDNEVISEISQIEIKKV